MNPIAVISVASATLAGLAGSVHCLAMCGGMAGALGLRAGRGGANAMSRVQAASLYHVGRLSGYALAGALCGGLGAGAQWLDRSSAVVDVLRIASGVLMLLIAARIALRWNALSSLERAGARFWTHLRPLAIRQATDGGARGALTLGLLWGWLPCGLVYSMLLFAAMSGNAVTGAAILFAYGVGTLPSMLGATLFAGQVQSWLQRPAWRMGTGVVLGLFGIWTVIAAAVAPHAVLFCG
jgi:sulfite exporter TauE/SafE